MNRVFGSMLILVVVAPLPAAENDWTGATIAFNFDNPKGAPWPADTKVLPKKRPREIHLLVRTETGATVELEMSGIMPMQVREDRGDGLVLIHDGHRLGWVRKNDLVAKEDAPLYWDQAVKANPRDTWALYMRGNGWWQKGELEKAIADFTECIRLDPADSGPFNSRGNAWRDKKEFDKAIDDFSAAIRIDPNFSLAYNNRGNAWRDKKDYDQAIDDYTEAIHFDPLYPPPYINRGLCWADKHDYHRAIGDYTEALRLDPKSLAGYYYRATAEVASKHYEGALTDSTLVIQLDPKQVGAFLLRGMANHRLQKNDKALKDFAYVLERDPKNSRALWYKAMTLAQLKKYDAAVESFDATMKLDPSAAVYRDYAFFLSTCPEARYRNSPKAISMARTAIEKAGTEANWEYHVARAAAYAEFGDFERALTEQRKALADRTLDRYDRKAVEAQFLLYKSGRPYRTP
jgi:tetratricopeptide (TPR) repeat protein